MNKAVARNFLVPITFGRHQRITSGVLDDRAVTAFNQGQCFAFAYTFLESLPEPLRKAGTIKFLYQHDDKTHKKHLVHSYVSLAEHILDINGIGDEFAYVGKWVVRESPYQFTLDALTWEHISSLDEDQIRLLIEDTPKQRVDTAKHFVQAVKDAILDTIQDNPNGYKIRASVWENV